MGLHSCLTVLHVSMLAALLVTLEADGEDSECEDEVMVNHNTVYEAFLGKELRINCTVAFCSDQPPIVVWYKIVNKAVPDSVSSSNNIRTEWRDSNLSEGISYLIFQNILMSDSGLYQCKSGEILSHNINVSVSANNQFEYFTSTVAHTTVGRVTAQREEIQETLCPLLCRLVGVLVFVIIVITLCLRPKCGRKGVCCAGRSRDAPDPSHQHHDSSVIHIYENDQ